MRVLWGIIISTITQKYETEKKPTKTNIINEFKNLLTEINNNELDEVVIQYSGHGTRIYDKSGDEKDYNTVKPVLTSYGKAIELIGPSGSGKSTFIRCINRLEEHQKGSIIVDGTELTTDLKNIDKIRSEVGMVFQHFSLFEIERSQRIYLGIIATTMATKPTAKQ